MSLRDKWVRPEPRRISGQDVEAGLKQMRVRGRTGLSTLAARLPTDRLPGPWRSLLLALLIVTLLLVLGATAVGQTRHERIVREHQEQARQLDEQARSASDPQEQESGDAEAIAKVRTRAQAAGKKVASGQNAFPKLLIARLDAMSASGAVDEKPLKAVVDQRRALGRLFNSETYVLEDERVYAWTAATDGHDGVQVEDGKVDPRLPWYLPEKTFEEAGAGSKASAKSRSVSTCTWQVSAVDPRLDEPRIADVVWLCETRDDTTMAWASGVYDAGAGTFDDLEVAVARDDEGVGGGDR